MKTMKSVLALVLALCLMMALAVPAFATETVAETTSAAAESTGAAEETTAAAEETTAAEEKNETEAEATEEVLTDGAAETTGAAADEEHDHDHDHDHDTTTEKKPVSGWKIFVTVLEVIASIVLVFVILMQSGKEAGLSGALSGNSDSYMNKNGMGGLDKKLAAATKWVALAWVVLTLILALIP